VIECGLRELLEETNIKATFKDLIFFQEFIRTEEKKNFLFFVILAEA